MTATRIDYAAGWLGVPGWLADVEGESLQAAVRSTTGAIVELGTWAGRSLCCLAAARDCAKQYDRPIVSFDSYPEVGQAQEAGAKDMDITPAEAKSLCNRVCAWCGIKYVFRFYSDALDGPAEYRKHPRLAGVPVGVLYIDDHHTGERLLAELAAWEPLLADECEVCIHDFYHEPYGLEAAVDRWMLDNPEWIMVETRLSMARLRRRWKAAPRHRAVERRRLVGGGGQFVSMPPSIDTPLVSVLYNTWRVGGLDCLKAGLDRQTLGAPSFEVVIVDALYRYRAQAVYDYFKDAPYRVKHVNVTDNPFPRDAGNLARNDAIRAASGDVCVWWCDYSLADAASLERHYATVARTGFRGSSCGQIAYGEIAVDALHPAFRDALPFRTIDDYADFVEALPADSPLWTTIFKGPPLEMARAGLICAQAGHGQPYELRGRMEVSQRAPIARDLRLEFPNGPLPQIDFYYAKNEATARDVLLEINGWEESFDDGHASDDMDICRRLAIAGSTLVNDKGNECIVPNPRPFFPLLRWRRTPKENRTLYNTLSAINRPRAIQGLVNEMDQIPQPAVGHRLPAGVPT